MGRSASFSERRATFAWTGTPSPGACSPCSTPMTRTRCRRGFASSGSASASQKRYVWTLRAIVWTLRAIVWMLNAREAIPPATSRAPSRCGGGYAPI
eukprot:1175625-Prorocentrum_minimum.AAC.1